MADSAGTYRILLDPVWINIIRDDESEPAETFEIRDGCEDPERSYDESWEPSALKGGKGRGLKRPALADDTFTENHQGLGVLDILPASPQIIFTHGSGRDIFQEGFVHFMRGMARNHNVLAFNKDRETAGSRREELFKRTAAFNYFFNDAYSGIRALGGRSFGARAAARASVYSTNKNLIFWSYPLINDADWRKDELIALSEDTRVLFIKGEKDWMGPGLLMDFVRKQMKAKTWRITVKDLDHNFTCKTLSEEKKICNALGVIAGMWLTRNRWSTPDSPGPWDPAYGTEMEMHWDATIQQAVWTDWTFPDEDPNKDGITVQLNAADDSKLSFQLQA